MVLGFAEITEMVKFAAARGARLDAADNELRPLIAKALAKDDSTGWGDIADAASVLWLELFEKSAPKAYQDAALARFRKDILASLNKTSTPSDPPTDGEINRVTNWVSSFTSNNATFQGAYATGQRQKQWVTRHDDKVRHAHARIDGQKVSMSGTFDVDGNKLHYPGEPVGPPEVWINCRCLVMGVGKKTVMSTKFAPQKGVDPFPPKKPVVGDDTSAPTGSMWVVALPTKGHPIHKVSSEKPTHMTLNSLGDSSKIAPADKDAIHAHVAKVAAAQTGPVTDRVSGRGTLGPNKADVQLMNGDSTVPIRKQLLGEQPPAAVTAAATAPDDAPASPIAKATDASQQFPTFIPHVTLGYPDSPANGDPDFDEIPFDRLAVWDGNNVTQYALGGDGTPLPTDDELDDDQAPNAKYKQPDGSTKDGQGETIEEAPDDSDFANEDDFVDTNMLIPFHGVAAPIGVTSGDGRRFASAAGVSWRQLPLPFKYQPMTAEGHDFATSVGRVDNLFIEDNLIKYEGVFNSSLDAQTVIEGIVFGDIRSVSVDLGAAELDFSIDDEQNGMPITDFAAVQIAAITAVSVGAFQEAFIALGTWAEDCGCNDAEDTTHEGDAPTEDESEAPAEDEQEFEQGLIEFLESLGVEVITAAGGFEFAPGTHDGPGWITNPRATERIRAYWVHGKGALKIRWGVPGDFNRCRKQLAKYVQNPEWLAGLCANMHKEAIQVWPGQEDGGRGHHHIAASGIEIEMAPSVTFITASGVSQKPAAWFAQPDLDRPTQLTISDNGRIYGHLAAWGVCHIGMPGTCTTPPHSASDYAYFHTGSIETDEGLVSVGHFTRGIGHAGGGVSMAQATAHYDSTDAIWADVAVGEDDFGIWFAGALRDDVTQEEIAELRASGALSGDWRGPSQDRLELVAAVAVGTPGFPIPRSRITASGGVQTSLVAAGIVSETEEPEILGTPTPLELQTQLAIVRATADEVEFRMARRARITAMRNSERDKRLAQLAPLRQEEMA